MKRKTAVYGWENGGLFFLSQLPYKIAPFSTPSPYEQGENSIHFLSYIS